MNITLSNRTFNGKHKWFYFAILDLNDLIGRPFTFILGDNNTFKDWHVNFKGIKKESGKYEFFMWLKEQIEHLEKQKESVEIIIQE